MRPAAAALRQTPSDSGGLAGVDEPIELRIYRGRFSKWIDSSKDKRAVAIIRARLNRIRLGNFGDAKSVGGGVEELRSIPDPDTWSILARRQIGGDTVLRRKQTDAEQR